MQCPKVCNGYFYRCWFAWSSCPVLDPSPGGNDDPTAESPDVAQGDPGPLGMVKQGQPGGAALSLR